MACIIDVLAFSQKVNVFRKTFQLTQPQPLLFHHHSLGWEAGTKAPQVKLAIPHKKAESQQGDIPDVTAKTPPLTQLHGNPNPGIKILNAESTNDSSFE